MRFIVIVLDGLRPDLVTPQAMPAVAALMQRGTRFANARSVFPSETRVATPSFATGCRPAAHGMTANTLFDARLAPDRLLRTKEPEAVAILAEGGETPLQRPTLGEFLAAAGKSLAVVSAGTPGQTLMLHPRARSLGAFRWNAADMDTAEAARVRDAVGPTPEAAVPNIPRVEHAARVMTDYVLPEVRAEVTVFWCPEPDVSFHYRGLASDDTTRAMDAADAAVARIVAWRDAQPDSDAIGIVVMSDHGHVTGPSKIDLAAELRAGGFAAGQSFADGCEIAVAPAGAPGLWLRDAAMAPRVVAWLAEQAWAGPVFARDPGIAPGVHPLAMLGVAHPRAADLVLCFAGSEGPDAHGLHGTAPFDAPDVPVGGGMHGGLHRSELAIVLGMEGGPFRRGAVVQAMADLTDVTPTLCALLGVATPGVEGRALHEAVDAAAEVAPQPHDMALGRGFVLHGAMQQGRFYPTALVRAQATA